MSSSILFDVMLSFFIRLMLECSMYCFSPSSGLIFSEDVKQSCFLFWTMSRFSLHVILRIKVMVSASDVVRITENPLMSEREVIHA